MSAKINFSYEKSETGDVSVVAKMAADDASELEQAYAKQAMVYVHSLLASDLGDLSIPDDLGLNARIVLTSGLPSEHDGDDYEEEDFDNPVPFGATSPKQNVEKSEGDDMCISVTLYFNANFPDIGGLNHAHLVVAKAAYEMVSEAIKTVTV